MSKKTLSVITSLLGSAFLLTVTLLLLGGGHAEARPTAADTAIGQDAGVQLSPGYSQYAAPGSVVTYSHTITNIGPTTDTFYLQAANSHGWTVTLDGAGLDGTPSLSLTVSGEGGAAAFTVSVTVPPATPASVTATTLVSATSISPSPTVSATVTDTTVVSVTNRTTYLPLAARNYVPDWSQGGLAGRTVYQLAVCTQDPQYLYAGTDTGVFRSTDAGASWQATGLQGIAVRGLDVTTNCSQIYAATFGHYVQHSIDGGNHWSGLSAGLPEPYLYTVVADPSSDRLYAGTASHGVYQSGNGGTTWQSIFEPNTGAIARLTLPASNTLLVATWGGNAYRLTLTETTWTPNRLNVPNNNVFEVVQRNGGTFFVATEGGLYRGAGITWTAVYTGATYGVALDADQPQVLYAATSNGAWYSTDGGEEFERFGLEGMTVRHIAPGPPQPKSVLLHAGTANGAWRRTRPGPIVQ